MSGKKNKIFEQIYKEVKKIRKGEVKTYKEIAQKLKISPRVVGWALHQNPDPEKIPCHRVVFKGYFLSVGYAFGGILAQKTKLESEGLKIVKDNKRWKIVNFPSKDSQNKKI